MNGFYEDNSTIVGISLHLFSVHTFVYKLKAINSPSLQCELTLPIYHDMANKYHILHGHTYFFHFQSIGPLFHIKGLIPLSS